VPLGSLLGPSQAVLEGFGPPKIERTNFKVFAIAGFRYFEALDGPFGLILAPLGPIWSKMGPHNGPKNAQTNAQKLVQKLTPKITKHAPILGPKLDPKMVQDGEVGVQANQDGGFSKALGPKIAPRWLKMASSTPR